MQIITTKCRFKKSKLNPAPKAHSNLLFIISLTGSGQMPVLKDVKVLENPRDIVARADEIIENYIKRKQNPAITGKSMAAHGTANPLNIFGICVSAVCTAVFFSLSIYYLYLYFTL